MSIEPLTQPQPPSSSPLSGSARHLVPMLLESGLPFAIYFLVKGLTGASDIVALSLGALAPAVLTIGQLLRGKRLNVISILILLGMVGSIGAALLNGNARLLLIRESAIGGLIGLSFLVSLCLRRPLFFTLTRQIRAGNDPQKLEIFEQRWQQPVMRRAYRVATLVWGLILVGELAVRVTMALSLPMALAVTLTTFVPLSIIGATILWSLWYMQRANQKARA